MCQNQVSPLKDDRKNMVQNARIATFLSSLTGLNSVGHRFPTHEWVGYYLSSLAGLADWRSALPKVGAILALALASLTNPTLVHGAPLASSDSVFWTLDTSREFPKI